MSKEMMIIFVYDTECCKKEEDDPASAVLYFHPNWVSDHQRLALVGQLVGTTYFLNSVFSSPRMITLESGKFAIKRFSRYILAVGTDRNIADWVIEHRANILSSLIMLFHCNIDLIYQITTGTFQSTKNFKEKLYQIFETYLPILQYGGNKFSNAPIMQLPKSASNVFLEAIQILQCCQDLQGVLGGVILYHNKIVATQMSSDITKILVMTDPYRIKCTAESVNVSFDLPDGVQLLQVYISKDEYCQLKHTAEKCKMAFESNGNKKSKKTFTPKVATTSKEPVFSAMKRDQSIIFSTVPEEDSENVTQPQNNKKKFIERPRSLSLFSTTADVINNEKKKVQTPYRSQASVCSTPLGEKVLHGNVMSICRNPDEELDNKKNTLPGDKNNTNNQDSKKLLKNQMMQEIKKNFMLKDIKNNITKFSKNVTLKYYGIGLKTMPTTPLGDEDDEQNHPGKLYHSTTITDPLFPVFRNDGLMPISKSLYEEQIIRNLESLKTDIETKNDNENDVNYFKNFESEFKLFPKENNNSNVENSENSNINIDSNKVSEKKIDTDFKKRRHSLNLPLKSLTLDSSVDDEHPKPISPVRKNLGGVQLTPLLSKLTILAMDEKSSGIGSRDTTPSEFRDYIFNDKNSLSAMATKQDEKSREIADDELNFVDATDLEKVGLFICGQQNMVLMLLLENDMCQDPETILKLHEICSNTLNQLELRLHQCIDPCSGATTDIVTDPYSFLSLDQKWDVVQRGGPWGVSELSIITHLHKDFMDIKNLCEVIVRNDESIVYGYRHSSTELFYHQNSPSHAGLPTPADLMGTVPLKAKRRLERDHAIILL